MIGRVKRIFASFLVQFYKIFWCSNFGFHQLDPEDLEVACSWFKTSFVNILLALPMLSHVFYTLSSTCSPSLVHYVTEQSCCISSITPNNVTPLFTVTSICPMIQFHKYCSRRNLSVCIVDIAVCSLPLFHVFGGDVCFGHVTSAVVCAGRCLLYSMFSSSVLIT